MSSITLIKSAIPQAKNDLSITAKRITSLEQEIRQLGNLNSIELQGIEQYQRDFITVADDLADYQKSINSMIGFLANAHTSYDTLDKTEMSTAAIDEIYQFIANNVSNNTTYDGAKYNTLTDMFDDFFTKSPYFSNLKDMYESMHLGDYLDMNLASFLNDALNLNVDDTLLSHFTGMAEEKVLDSILSETNITGSQLLSYIGISKEAISNSFDIGNYMGEGLSGMLHYGLHITGDSLFEYGYDVAVDTVSLLEPLERGLADWMGYDYIPVDQRFAELGKLTGLDQYYEDAGFIEGTASMVWSQRDVIVDFYDDLAGDVGESVSDVVGDIGDAANGMVKATTNGVGSVIDGLLSFF